MARTISEIYDVIIAEKSEMAELQNLTTPDSAQTLLTELTTNSKVSVWGLWAWVIAVAIWVQEKLWDEFKAEVDAIVEAAVPGTARWYREQVLNYQHGDALVLVGDKYQYVSEDVSKQIIKKCSVTESAGELKIKVAKADNVPLSGAEQSGLNDYLAMIKFAGTRTLIMSYNADQLRINATVYVNSTLLGASDGESMSEAGTYPVIDAIEDFIASLPWNGVLYLSQLTDAIQAVAGVTDVVLHGATASKDDPLSFSDITRKYQTFAGHIVFDDAGSTITYSADV